MKVVFLKEVQGTAASGDVKEVAPGFARNYLFPRRLAVAATPAAMTHAAKTRAAAERKEAKVKADASELAERLATVYLNITARAGEEGRLFCSVTSQDV